MASEGSGVSRIHARGKDKETYQLIPINNLYLILSESVDLVYESVDI